MHAVLERVVSQIGSEVLGLDAETTQLHPNGLAYKWSAQQVVEHLVLGYRLTSRALETRLSKGRLSRNRKCTYLQWSLQLMILTLGKLPRGVPALDETMPVAGGFAAMDGQQLGNLMSQEIDAMDKLFDACRRKFSMERVAVHPFLGPLRVDQWRRFHVVHGLHHLTQLRSVIEQVAPMRVPVTIAGPTLVEKLQVPAQRPLA
jgi:Protein of unknown function (DUF1569)